MPRLQHCSHSLAGYYCNHCIVLFIQRCGQKLIKIHKRKKKSKIILLSPLESNYCYHFLIMGMQHYKITLRNSWSQSGLWPLGACALTSICDQKSLFLPSFPRFQRWVCRAVGTNSCSEDGILQLGHIRAADLTYMHYFLFQWEIKNVAEPLVCHLRNRNCHFCLPLRCCCIWAGIRAGVQGVLI